MNSLIISLLILPAVLFAKEPKPTSFSLNTLAESAYTDHVLAFQKVFDHIPVHSFLEFGLGKSTQFFLENCPLVASLELTSLCTASLSFSWYKECVDLFIDHYPHWRPSLRFCSPLMNILTSDRQGGVPPIDVEQQFLQEISSICAQGLSLVGNECTLAFVDSGTAGRVDLVNELLKRNIPIVAAHDTKSAFYHWERLNVPKEYIAIEFPVREHITFWFHTNYVDAATIQILRESAEHMKTSFHERHASI